MMAGRCEWCGREAEDVRLENSYSYCPECRREVRTLDALIWMAMATDPKTQGVERAREMRKKLSDNGLL